jgi:uncharacterized membrane protein
MGNGKTIGMTLFVGGIILLIAYGLYQGIRNIKEIDIVIFIGAMAIIIGLLLLLITIVMEQRRDTKRMKKEIRKEELEP